MTGFINRGLGQVDDAGSFDWSFLGGSSLTGFAIGAGIIFLFASGILGPGPRSVRRSQKRSRAERQKYVSHVAKLHKLSRKDQQYLMEHEE